MDETQVGLSGDYYFDIYKTNPASDDLAEVQFSIAYGHIDGGGSPPLTQNQLSKLSTKAIYSQYRNLLLDPSDAKFTFEGLESDHIYVINMQRARVKEQLDPGNWELPLSGANGVFTFIDDSGQTLGALTANSKAGRVFKLISGSITIGAEGITTASSGVLSTYGTDGPGYGLVYPDLGIVILNPEAICPMVGFFGDSNAVATGSAASSSVTTPLYLESAVDTATIPYAPITGSITYGATDSAYNHGALFASINNAIVGGKKFYARSAETISSTHYFVRLRNKQYNYSNNPTFYNPDNGALIVADFKNNPQTYITAVGLYNDQNELLAVAKLSSPLPKSFDEEILLRVRLDF